VLKDLSGTHFPQATKIVLVQDNLNIHKPASLYEVFPAADAPRLVERFEWHLHAQAWQLVGYGRVRTQRPVGPVSRSAYPRIANLIEEVAAWECDRNKNHAKADWQFANVDARIKLKRQ
jgi:hypothetical protein